MKQVLETMITVQDYVNELVADARYESTLVRVEDYVNAIRTSSINAQKSSFITVQEYVKELNAEEVALTAEIESEISSKSYKEAQKLEQLLA